MNQNAYERPRDGFEDFLQDVFDENSDIEHDYEQLQIIANADADAIIVALTASEADIKAVLDFRTRIGEESGIEQTVVMLGGIHERFAVYESFNKLFHPAMLIGTLATHIGNHSVSPDAYPRRDAEAIVLTNDWLDAEQKKAWMQAIAMIMDEEGLDVEDPSTQEYLKKYLKHQADERAATRISMENYRFLELAFEDIKQELNISHHDDLELVTHSLLNAFTAVAVDLEKQLQYRTIMMGIAHSGAKQLGWSKETFDQVVQRLRQIEL